jgi:hypothetical protein
MIGKVFCAVITIALAAVPADARPRASTPSHTQSIYCATREAGNPYSRFCDYEAWSLWRARGGWDSQLDDACWRNPQYVPAGCPRWDLR